MLGVDFFSKWMLQRFSFVVFKSEQNKSNKIFKVATRKTTSGPVTHVTVGLNLVVSASSEWYSSFTPVLEMKQCLCHIG